MNQLAIDFDSRKLARASDPLTSVRAAEKTRTFAKHHESAIFNAIHEAGPDGAQYKEIAAMTGMEPVQVARRLSSMGERKLIERRVKEGAVRADDWQERAGCALWWRRV